MVYKTEGLELVTILVYSNDAGGAEIISSWIKEKKIRDFECILNGPAKKIFEQKFKSIKTGKFKITEYKKFFFSTSFPPKKEIDILKYYKNKIETVCFLDHWVNYRERLKLKNKIYLPDKFYTFDKSAYLIAKKKFRNSKIIMQKNYFIHDLKTKLNKFKIEDKYLLVLSSPKYNSLKNYSNHKSIKINKQNLKLLLNTVATLSLKKKFKNKKILIRPHPSEKHLSFNWIKKEIKGIKIQISNNTLLKDISKS